MADKMRWKEGNRENYLYKLEIELPADHQLKEVLLTYADWEMSKLKDALKKMGGTDVHVSIK